MATRPTVIGGATPPPADSSTPLAPTRIGSPGPTAPASALPSAPSPASAAPLPSAMPTRLPAAAPPTAPPAASHALSVVTTKADATPSRLPGVPRKPLAVDDATLAEQFPDAPPTLLARARLLLAGVVPAVFDRPAAERFGRETQARHAALVDELLQLMDHELLRAAPRHIERLLALLEDLAETLAPSTSALPWSRRKAPRARLATLRPEIDTLRAALEAADGPLAKLRAQLATNQQAAAELLTELQALGLATEALPGLLPAAQRETLALSLQDRLVSLARTQATLQQHRLQAEQADHQLAQLASRLHDTVRVSLPAWLASMAALPAEPAHDTERFLLQERLHAVINGLKS
ncbi:MAG TPA: hypothetical protein VLA61_04120 [Ideonella sp.]|uniref:hypothetical protein n=1 Tax=Ideonella sp. TaxID=1929293 RepID=UPI002C1104CA|nr:hypothetical protein [Ideonella sp.]HSI47426.1 hypothetical protein [Ideonella sp.]